MNRWLMLALAGVTLAVGALMLGTAPLLPDRVATHFDWNGHANGWMTREGHVVFVLAIGVALPWIVYGLVPLLARKYPRLASVRDQVYWLDPSRRDATLQVQRAFAGAIAILMSLFVLSLHLMLVEANATQPPRLDNGTLAIAVALFVVAMLGIAAAHKLRFRRRPDRALQP